MTKPKTVTSRQLSKLANGWADPVLECRTLGHAWRQTNAVHVRTERYWLVLYTCLRNCGVRKKEEWDEQGRNVKPASLDYPRNEDGSPAYLAEGVGRVVGEVKGVLRLERVKRNGFTEERRASA